MIRTNSREWWKVLIYSYKSLWQVEYRFRDLKAPLRITPTYHFTGRRIRSYVFICFLTLVLELSLREYLVNLGQPYEYKALLKSLSLLEVTIVEDEGRYWGLRPLLDSASRLAFKACGFSSGARIENLTDFLSKEWLRETSVTGEVCPSGSRSDT